MPSKRERESSILTDDDNHSVMTNEGTEGYAMDQENQEEEVKK